MSPVESQKTILRSRLAAAAVEATTVIASSLRQITVVFDEINVIQGKLDEEHDYNFATTNTMNFFPKHLLKHVETFADGYVLKKKTSRVKRRLMAATRKQRRSKSKSDKRAAQEDDGKRDRVFLTHVEEEEDEEEDEEELEQEADRDREQENEQREGVRGGDIEEGGENIDDDDGVFDVQFSDDEGVDREDAAGGQSDEEEDDAGEEAPAAAVPPTRQRDGTDRDRDIAKKRGTTAGPKKKKKKKKLPWNESPCAQCSHAFRGEGKVSHFTSLL
jgi:hypothetical protein